MPNFIRVSIIPVRPLVARTPVPLSDDFQLRPIGPELRGKDMVQPLHRHDHYFLLVLATGKGVHECDLRAHALRPRTIYTMRPRQVHRLELKAGATGYFMQFTADFLAQGGPDARVLLRRAGHVEVFHTNAQRYAELLRLLDRIARECAAGRDGHLHIVRAYLQAFLAELAMGAPASGPASGYARERLDELLELIEQHVHQSKEVSAYAARMHLSTYQLNAIAKAGTGRTCSQLITDQLVLEAKRYLLATTDQVGQVADRLGYDDVSYFIRFFKKHTGHTPEAFRHRAR